MAAFKPTNQQQRHVPRLYHSHTTIATTAQARPEIGHRYNFGDQYPRYGQRSFSFELAETGTRTARLQESAHCGWLMNHENDKPDTHETSFPLSAGHHVGYPDISMDDMRMMRRNCPRVRA